MGIENQLGLFENSNRKEMLGFTKDLWPLFLRRASLSDHTNFNLIKKAYRGFWQLEVPGVCGVPRQMLKVLDTADIIGLYYGSFNTKGNLFDRKHLIGQNTGNLVKDLIYQSFDFKDRPNKSTSAIRAIRNEKLGYCGNWDETISERVENLDEDVKINFLHSFFSPVYRVHDEVYDAHRRMNRGAIDSNKSRNAYAMSLAQLFENKRIGNDGDFSRGFDGKIIESSTDKNKVYFMQRNASLIPNDTKGGFNEFVRYDCSCPHGLLRMYSRRKRENECKHLKEYRKEFD
jgi:hypothetical protein